ncbi:MAG: RNA polymerase sigma-70 factor [Tannerella sp.]|nr:RNA polymerase sigma-70 factor [Tannerella sp.]
MDEQNGFFGKEKDDSMNQLSRLYKKYAPGMLCYARKFVDFQTAEDLVHDVFLKLLSQDSFQVIDQTIENYLLCAVKNACSDYLKHQIVRDDYLSQAAHELKMEELSFSDNPLTELIGKERKTSLYKAIDRLPKRCREVFKLAYLEEIENAEIARMLNISVRTVEAQIYKALKILRSILTAFLGWIV